MMSRKGCNFLYEHFKIRRKFAILRERNDRQVVSLHGAKSFTRNLEWGMEHLANEGLPEGEHRLLVSQCDPSAQHILWKRKWCLHEDGTASLPSQVCWRFSLGFSRADLQFCLLVQEHDAREGFLYGHHFRIFMMFLTKLERSLQYRNRYELELQLNFSKTFPPLLLSANQAHRRLDCQ